MVIRPKKGEKPVLKTEPQIVLFDPVAIAKRRAALDPSFEKSRLAQNKKLDLKRLESDKTVDDRVKVYALYLIDKSGDKEYFYVGLSNNPDVRFLAHKKLSASDFSKEAYEFVRHHPNKDTLSMEILSDHADIPEAEWVEAFKTDGHTLYNTIGGNTRPRRRKKTPEERAKDVELRKILLGKEDMPVKSVAQHIEEVLEIVFKNPGAVLSDTQQHYLELFDRYRQANPANGIILNRSEYLELCQKEQRHNWAKK